MDLIQFGSISEIQNLTRMILQTTSKRNQRNSVTVKMRITLKALRAGLPANMLKETKFQMQFNLPQPTISIHSDHERREHFLFTYMFITNDFCLH